MTGLNDSFLVDDGLEPQHTPAVTLNVFKSNPEDPDVPELRDDVDLIAVAAEEMQISFRDLQLLQESIRNQGGMTRQIALEAHAIMPTFLHDDRPAEYFTQMPSRTLLAAALEDIGNEKKSLLKRMMEKILEFIKKLAKRIKDYFIVDPEKVKADQEFAKNYKGPTDEQLQKAAAQAEAAEGKPNTTKPERDQTGDVDKGGPIDNKKPQRSGSSFNVPHEIREKYENEKMALITAMLGKDRLALIAAMMEPGFKKSFDAAVQLGIAWTGAGVTNKIDVIQKRISELDYEINNCNNVISEFVNDGEDSNRKVLAGWVTGKNSTNSAFITTYFLGHPVPCLACVRQIEEYIVELHAEVEKANHTDPQEHQQHLLHVQKEVAALGTLVTLIAKVDNAYSTVIKGLRK